MISHERSKSLVQRIHAADSLSNSQIFFFFFFFFLRNTALHLAVFSGRSDLVSLLLANDADVNSLNADQNTPLHIACQTSVKPQVILSLIHVSLL